MQRDHIHIALTQKEIWLFGTPCPVQAIQIPAFIKNHCLRGVQVFWLCIAHNTAAKSDHPAVDIHDRKHHTIPELVIHPVLFINADQSRLGNHIIFIPFGLQIPIQVIAVLIRITQPERLNGLITKLTLFKIFQSDRTPAALKLYIIILCCSFVDLQKYRSGIRTFFCFSGILFLRKFHSCPVCQIFQRFNKCIILILHQKCKYISSCPASKAIIHLLLSADRKRRRLFIMKRAQAKI